VRDVRSPDSPRDRADRLRAELDALWCSPGFFDPAENSRILGELRALVPELPATPGVEGERRSQRQPMRGGPVSDPQEELWWCNTHGRRATAVDSRGRHCCDPRLGGILLPCEAGGVVDLTGLVELVEVSE
jgi:hypothetical protein